MKSVTTPRQFSLKVNGVRCNSETTIQNGNLTLPNSSSSRQKVHGTNFIKYTDEPPISNQENVFYIRKVCPQETKVKNYTTVKQYSITTETIMEAIQKQSKENIEESDKRLDIYCRNLHGQFKTFTPSVIDAEVIRMMNIWRMWYKMYPSLRSTPLIYKCYICCKGWWRLYPFKEHLKEHKDPDLKLRSEPVYHNFNIIATTNHAKMIKTVKMDSNCWKCGRDPTFHNYNCNLQKYHCPGCNERVFTCARLQEHENICIKYMEWKCEKYKVNASDALTCTICGKCCVNEDILDDHLIDCHLVRSDEPIVLDSKLCRFCSGRYIIFKFHDCPAKPKPHQCDVCCRTFSSLVLSQIHIEYSRGHTVECTICEKHISQCMVPKHYLKHSKNYCLINMCNICNTDLLFANETICANHINAHSKGYSSGQILLPTKCVNGEIVKSKTTFQIPDKNLDNFLAGLEDIKGTPIETTVIHQRAERSNLHTLSIPDRATDDDSDIIILDSDDVEPSMESASNPQNLYDREFDIKAMQEQLDEEIMRDLEAEATICKLFQASKGYRLIQKEYLEKMSEENTLIKEEPKMEELEEKGSIKKLKHGESMKKELLNLEDNEDLNQDLIILDYGVDDVTAISDSESEETPENNTYLNIENFNIINSYKREIDSESEDIVICCDSSDSMHNSDWDTSNVIKDESYTNHVPMEVEPEVFIQEKFKLESSECHPQKVYDDTLQMVADNTESIRTESGNQLCECKGCDYRGEWNQYIVHVSTECPGTEFSCTSCKKFDGFKNLNHYLKHLTVPDCALSCPECKLQQKSLEELYAHVNSHIQTLFSVAKSIKPQEMSFYCKKCGNCVRLEHVFNHWEYHLDSRCPGPSEEDSISSEDSSDSSQDEGLEKPMSAELLKEVLDLLQNKERERKLTRCIVCSRKSPRWQDCKRHLLEHLLSQAMHRKRKTKSAVVKCYFCNIGFKTKYHWKIHMREHCNLKVYKCELCSKCFCDSSNLCKHRKAHNLFAFVCDLCGGKFLIKRSLIKHLKMHENALQCTKCNMSFLTKSKLKKHMSSKHHKYRKRQFPCTICYRTFMTWKERLQHLWRKHDRREVLADCSLCDGRFRKITDLKRHMKLRHNITYKKPPANEVKGN